MAQFLEPQTSPAGNRSGKLERRRTQLREFQAQLVERMQAAKIGGATHTNQLGLQIGSLRVLISLAQAGEIVPLSTITPVPLTQDWFLGVANIRGNLVSVADLGRFTGGAQTPIDKDSRVVAFGPALNFNAALLVSQVLGLRNMAQLRPAEPAEQQSSERAAWCSATWVDSEGQIWQELDLEQATHDARFLQIGI
jgi:twitching motility protein PilI